MSRSWKFPVGLILVSTYLTYESFSITSPIIQAKTVGPAFFPRVALAGLIVVGALLLAQALFARQAVTTPSIDHEGADAPSLYWWDFVNTLFLGGLYVGGMRIVGFIPATILFQSVMLFVVFRQRSRKVIIGAPFILTFLYFFVFIRFLGMPLPQGYGIFRNFSQSVYY